MVKYTGGPCGISKHNLKHFSRFFESVVKYGVSKQNLKHFSRFCSKFGDNPNKNYPVSEQDVTKKNNSYS